MDGSAPAPHDMPAHYRTVWISDIHLGTRGCKAAVLLDFLRNTTSDYLYLVGDVIDLWRLRWSWYWQPSHNEVIHTLLRRARGGTRVTYVPGNHDDLLRKYVGGRMAGVAVKREAIHIAADGRTYWVTHGDDFDVFLRCPGIATRFGDIAYDAASMVNMGFNHLRRGLGLPYWSLKAFLKGRIRNAVVYVERFEHALAAAAARKGVDGVVCGHIHTPRIREIGDITYCNDGDWVDNCSALVEHPDGRLEIVNWLAVIAARADRVRVPELATAN
jgi:UDP-2,3-diacylglucosamine pyrophosphatase LpxH